MLELEAQIDHLKDGDQPRRSALRAAVIGATAEQEIDQADSAPELKAPPSTEQTEEQLPGGRLLSFLADPKKAKKKKKIAKPQEVSATTVFLERALLD